MTSDHLQDGTPVAYVDAALYIVPLDPLVLSSVVPGPAAEHPLGTW